MNTRTAATWARSHALTLFLFALVLALAASKMRSLQPQPFTSLSVAPAMGEIVYDSVAMDRAASSKMIAPAPDFYQSTPPSFSEDRQIIINTNLTLLVNDVAEVIATVNTKTKELGGFLVDSNLYQPEGADTGSISVRVPMEKKDEALNAFRGLAVKVVNEYVSGQDVTDQFEDLTAQLTVLEKTKTKLENLLDNASQVQDILSVQRELSQVQRQIDSVKGRQQYLERSADLVLISLSLSTDELALPYVPDDAWRPQVIFRQAVRELVRVFRQAGSGLIYVGVFAPIWLPILALLWWLQRRFR